MNDKVSSFGTDGFDRSLRWKDIRLFCDGQTLTVGNSRIRRVFDLTAGAPRTVSLQDGRGNELAQPGSGCDFSFVGLTPPGRSELPWRLTGVDMKVRRKSLFTRQGL